jgi:hypothetical protein
VPQSWFVRTAAISLSLPARVVRSEAEAIYRAERALELANLLCRHIEVALCRPDISVAELELNSAHVGARVERFDGRGMSQ